MVRPREGRSRQALGKIPKRHHELARIIMPKPGGIAELHDYSPIGVSLSRWLQRVTCI